ncbi:unnamed protein product [Caenorhabditis bovis]|uniref:MSP domain-containing protein n=1 Tax=Caenorhabditis bovis TaxID=2654633 RepID=A0A8S1ECH8_9PELO|nr:unnamed protein product [Caenorhabditis bovis]
MSLTFSTNSLKWNLPEGQNIVKITNDTKQNFAIKVKSTNAEIYSTAPVTEIIKAGYVLNLVVVRKKGPMKDEKLAIHYVEVEPTEIDAAEVFKKPKITPNVFMITMKCEE